MKFGDVTAQDVIKFARIEGDDTQLAPALLDAAKTHILGYTGLSFAEADSQERQDLALALLILSHDMYDNRLMTCENGAENKTVREIMDKYARNLLA